MFSRADVNRSFMHHGFTLVEISIVLIIVGLIIGGILFGRDLIEAAMVRKQISQLQSYTLAANTFKLKYNCLPGDCDDAVELELGVAGGDGDNGNGDGRVVDLPADRRLVHDGAEARNFWYHLSMADLIPGKYPTGTTYPIFNFGNARPGINSPPLVITGVGRNGNHPSTANNLGGVWIALSSKFTDAATGINSMPSTHSFLLTTSVGSSSDQDRAGVFYPPVAYAIDSKLDDGLPFTGNVKSFPYGILASGSCTGFLCMSTSSQNISLSNDYAACLNDTVSPTTYNVSPRSPGGAPLPWTDNSVCMLMVNAGF